VPGAFPESEEDATRSNQDRAFMWILQMEYGTKYFVLAEDKIQEIGIERLAQLYHGLVPEYAGQQIPYATLLFERVGDKLKDLRHWQGGYLVFDKQGKSDDISGQTVIELSLTTEKDPRSFVAKRADQIRRERAWHPTAEQ
jgi:hypothetical protein